MGDFTPVDFTLFGAFLFDSGLCPIWIAESSPNIDLISVLAPFATTWVSRARVLSLTGPDLPRRELQIDPLSFL